MDIRKGCLLLTVMIWSLYCVTLNGVAAEKTQKPEDEEEQPVEVELDRVHARIDPEIELIIPRGRFHLSFQDNFRKLHTRFSVNYEFLNNALDGSLRFSRPIGRIDPGVRFYDGIDFENYINPVIDNGNIVLFPTEEYVQRDRGVEVDAKLSLSRREQMTLSDNRGMFFSGGFRYNDTFRGDLKTAEILDEGNDYNLLGRFYYNNIREKQNLLGNFPIGTYVSTLFKMRYRNNFNTPVELSHKSEFVHYNDFYNKLIFSFNASISYPIKVWRDDLAVFYTLGGFDTIRGYPKNSIGAFRYVLFSTDMGYLIKSVEADIPEFFTMDFKLTRIRLPLLIDVLFSQKNLSMEAPVYVYASVGAGVSLDFIEGKKRQYTLKLYVSQALESGLRPVFYLSIISSRFRFQESEML